MIPHDKCNNSKYNLVRERLMLKLTITAIGTILAIASLTGATAQADAGSCQKVNTRFASTSNVLYISGADTVCTPADINTLYPKVVVKSSERVFLMKANLKLDKGATLEVTGGNAPDSTTDELRLMSNNNSTVKNFVNITADHGNVLFNNTNVKSWDEAKNAVDTEYGGTYKRAYIKVRSRILNGVANTSRMDIVNSDVGYLGYYGAEAYGLAWKVMDNAFSQVDVLGDIKDSRIHHNYFGAYMYGAFGMNIDNNEFDSNVKYGLDPHDDSDSLAITNNSLHDNGSHGIICSQRCDNLVIRGNLSYRNVGHGIMLHRSTDDSVVEDNTIMNNTDAGIALFESNNNLVRNNLIVGNGNGIRLSVGASFNTFESNTIEDTKKNSIYTYQGSDVPVRGDGINRGNIWNNNIVKRSGEAVLKLGGTDGNRFEGNDFRGNANAKYYLSGATNSVFMNNMTDPGVVLP